MFDEPGFGAVIPFVHHLGFTMEHFEGGESLLHYTPVLSIAIPSASRTVVR